MDGTRLLAGLDADQRRAVTDPAQPLCILAGAGSGKTRVLTRRIAHRSLEGTADPRHVLALTFTRKAAAEMGGRLSGLGLRDRPTVGTFHAIAWAQLRGRHRDRGRTPPALLERKARLLASLPGRGAVAVVDLATEIEWAKARQVGPGAYAAAAHAEDRRTRTPFEHVARLYETYEEEKRRRGVLDFDDILGRCAEALETDPTFAAAQRWRFRHLFVDEFQDVNPLQHRLLVAWLGDRTDLCVVGDPNQAIYRWNGADARYLTSFSTHHPGAEVVRLRGNYRSTPEVLALAGAALGPRTPTSTIAHRPPGDVPRITAYPTDEAEADGIAREARLLHAPGTRWDRQAVLVRTNGQMVHLERSLARARIPFRVRGGEPLLARPVVRDALRRGAAGGRRPLAHALDEVADAVDDAHTRGDDDGAEALAAVLRLGHELAGMDPSATTDDLRGWVAAAVGADGAGRAGDAVDVVTFHAAKGLEWPVVHLAGLEDGLVPISHARTPEAEAEERRLLHVAVTRAADVLRLSWAEERTLRDRPVARRPSPYLAALEAARTAAQGAARPVDPAPGIRTARRALARTAGHDPHLALVHALQAWRAEAARRASVPPAVVVSDRVLSEIARRRPHDEEDLAQVRGVGPLTVDAHGADILRVVDEHQRTDPCASR